MDACVAPQSIHLLPCSPTGTQSLFGLEVRVHGRYLVVTAPGAVTSINTYVSSRGYSITLRGLMPLVMEH